MDKSLIKAVHIEKGGFKALKRVTVRNCLKLEQNDIEQPDLASKYFCHIPVPSNQIGKKKALRFRSPIRGCSRIDLTGFSLLKTFNLHVNGLNTRRKVLVEDATLPPLWWNYL